MKTILLTKDDGIDTLDYLHHNTDLKCVVISKTEPCIITYCRSNQIPYLLVSEFESAVINKTVEYGIDIMDSKSIDSSIWVISYLYPAKINKCVIDAFETVINFHPAPLPNYRGVGGYNLCILTKMDWWGVTCHQVNEKIDGGEIVNKMQFDVGPNMLVSELKNLSLRFLMLLLKTVIEEAKDNNYQLYKHLLLKRYESVYLDRKHLEAMKKIELADLICIDQGSKELDLDLRSRAFWFPPYNGLYIEIAGKKYTLVSEEVLKKL